TIPELTVTHRNLVPALLFALGCSDYALNENLDAKGTSQSPAIEVEPSELDFGTALLDDDGQAITPTIETFRIHSVGTGTLEVGALALGGAYTGSFTILDDLEGVDLAPGESMEVDVAFEPQGTAAQTATIEVSSSDPEAEPQVRLVGSATHEPEDDNTAPTATIGSPSSSDVIPSSRTAYLEGTVDDAEDDSSTLLAWWTSDIDGYLGERAAYDSDDASLGSLSLSAGTHTLTLTVEDSEGLQGSDQVLVTVCQMNEEGTLQVESPGHIVTTVSSTDAGAVNALYAIEPTTATITTDANNDVGIASDLGHHAACTEIVFRLVTTAGGGGTFDSDTDPNFVIERSDTDAWMVYVEDSTDYDYNDIVFSVAGGQ
ncbi:MAG: hypothetical protein QGG40_13465, partial [Myxococcota bacterium]|nr:hypothetical protein [Myxococcota bacterium]